MGRLRKNTPKRDCAEASAFRKISLALSRVVIKGLPAIVRILSAFSGKPRGTGDRILNDFRRLPIV
jgi:hypothetical protein